MKRGWRKVVAPVIAFWSKDVGRFSRKIRKIALPRSDGVDFGPEGNDPMLTRKAAKRRSCETVLQTDSGGQGENPKAIE